MNNRYLTINSIDLKFKKKGILVFFFFLSLVSFSQENCNNGIDDDGDGKIDLNDPDCVCGTSAITSIIPNPSFESYTSCPSGFSELNVCSSWIQATEGTTDYHNTCGFVGNGLITLGLNNFPDGNAVTGVHFMSTYKEYLGATLLSQMLAGTSYQLKFNVSALLTDGFLNSIGNVDVLEPVNITLYGCANGSNLPLSTYGSPDQFDPTWIIIGSVLYDPISSWGETNIIFTPTININAIMLGAPPTVLSSNYEDNNAYLAFDNLLLNTASSFGVNISSTGNFCEDNLVLTANITATLGAGTTYQWYKNGIAIVGATSSSYSVPAIPINLGEYSVKITNGSTCYISTKYLINNITPGPSATTIQPNCITTTGTINITTPAWQYSFDNGTTWQNSSSKSFLAVGNYFIKTKSINGCISEATGVGINEPNLLNGSQFTVTQPTTCDGTGSITINSSIAAQYSFDDGVTWTTNPTATNLQPGTYLIKIKDATGCQSASQYAFINRIFLSNPVFSVTQPTCGTGGTISISSNADFYSFDDGVTWVSNAVATNLPTGVYLIKIKLANGCESNSVYAYLEPFYLNITPVINTIQPTCGNGGSITVGTTSAQYSFDGGVTWTTNNSATNLVSGYYEVVLKNDAGCINQSTWVYLEPFYLPSPNYTTTQPSCGVGGSITITTAAAAYSFDGGLTWSTSNTISNQPPGYYPIMIKNSLDCISSINYAALEDFYLPNPNYVAVNPYCGNIGSITITTPAAQYSFDGGTTWTTNNVATNLSAGYYYIKIKNSLGCESNYIFVYLDNNSLATPNMTVVQPGCNITGSITITTSAAQYSFDGGTTWVTNPILSNLPAGNYYNVMIKNSAGCVSYPQGVYMQQFYLPDPLFTVVQPTCGIGGSITITTPAAEYSFDGGTTWTTNPVASNLTPNYYYIQIKNNLGCVSSQQYVYIESFYLPVPFYTVTQPTCGVNGSITITTPAAEYSFDGGTTWTTNPVASNLTPNYYYIQTKNNLGCLSIQQYVYIEPYYLPFPTFTVTQPTCEVNGSITITTPAAEYSFDGGATWTTNPVASNLTPNYYYIQIKNNLGCISIQQYVYIEPFYLPEPTFIVTQPTCIVNGSITITTLAAEYSFDGGTTWTTNPVLNNPTSGYHYIMIRNNANCSSYTAYASVNYAPNIPDAPLVTFIQPTNCGSSNGSITVTASAVNYSFDNGVTWSNNSYSGPLAAGTYLVKIKTAISGCESPATTVILNPINGTLNPPNFTVIQPTCSSPTGAINITTTSSLYSFDNGVTFVPTNSQANFLPGTYQIKIKDASGCISTAASVVINAIANLPAPIATVTHPTCNLITGSITITTNASEYSFDNGVTFLNSNVLSGLIPGNYNLKIKDSNGCISNAVNITINNVPNIPYQPIVTISHPVNCNSQTGSITVVSTGVSFSFDNGTTWSNSNIANSLIPGNYTVLIKTAINGCASLPTNVTINTPPDIPLAPVVVVTQPESCLNPFGSISVTSNSLQYSFDNGVTWSNNSNSGPLAAGTYLVKIKAAISGCESPATTVTLNPINGNITPPNFTVIQPDCNNPNGSITILTDANEYSFDNGTTWTNSNSLANLVPGSYSLKTKNDLGCISNPSIATINSYTNNIPLPTSMSPQTFCVQQNATINTIVINGQNVKWYDAATGGNLLLSTTNLVNGMTYYASQTINGCESNRISILVNIQNTPAPSAINQSFCSTENATLSSIIINGSSILWYADATSTIPLPSNTLVANNTTYYASQTITNCESTNRIPVTISLINTLNATNHSVSFCDDLNDTTEQVNLINYNSFLTTSTNSVFNYYTTLESANQNSGQIINFTNYNLNIGTTVLYVRIENPNSCFQIVTLTLTLYSKPNITIDPIEYLCEGENITLNAGNGFDTYLWSNGATSQTINVSQIGNYSVTVTKNYGTLTCSSNMNFEVKNSSKPILLNIEVVDWTDENNTITIVTSGQGNFEYSINGIDYQDSNIFTNLKPGEYQIYVKDKYGCGFISAFVSILNYPKFFTPNGDGINDYWSIYYSKLEPKLKVFIYDRYGKFIFNFDADSKGWDGNYNGFVLPSTDYWFVVYRENGKIHKGHFTLKR